MADHEGFKREVARKTAGLVFWLFLAACILPCLDGGPPSTEGAWPNPEEGWHFGLVILLFGYTGGNNGVPWSANLLLLLGVACLAFGRPQMAAALGVIASLLGLTTWWVRRGDSFLVGYYVWQACHLALTWGAVCVLRLSGTRDERIATRSAARCEAG
jgi:hypothetical protein